VARFDIQLEPMWGFAYVDFVCVARLAEDDEGLKQRSAELVAALGAKGEEVVERATRVGTAGTRTSWVTPCGDFRVCTFRISS